MSKVIGMAVEQSGTQANPCQTKTGKANASNTSVGSHRSGHFSVSSPCIAFRVQHLFPFRDIQAQKDQLLTSTKIRDSPLVISIALISPMFSVNLLTSV
jgi:hypothetical protein